MARKLFDKLPKREVSKIYNAGVMRNAAAGEIIFRRGDKGSEMYIIVQGRLAIIDEYHEKKKVIAQLEAGDCFGEMALFSHAKRSATVLAQEPSTLLVLDEKKLGALVQKKVSSTFLVNIIAMLASRLRHTNAHYMKAKYADVPDSILDRPGEKPGPAPEKLLDKEWKG